MSKQQSPDDLAHRAATGDRRAFEDLVKQFSQRVEGFVRSRMGQRVRQQLDVDDVVQETFAKAFQCIEKLTWQGEQAFFGWLACIAENILLSVSQKAMQRPLKLTGDHPDRATSPSKNLRRQERFDRFQKSLENLSADHREVIILARIKKLKISEIAKRMNRTPNAVKKLLGRALHELKRDFGDTESYHFPDKALNGAGNDD